MIKNKFNAKEFKIKLTIVCSLLALVILSFFFAEKLEAFFGLNETYSANQVSADKINSADYKVVYLDVGQGNCTYIKLPDGKTALIDAGNTMYGSEIVEFLNNENIKSIDYLIATHADADHIGGFASVLESFEVKNIYRPFQIAGNETFSGFVPTESEDLADVYLNFVESTNNRSKISKVTSEVYADFIDKIYDEHYFENGKKIFSKITVFYDGLKIIGENYSFEFLAPLVRDEKVDLSLVCENTSGYATIGYGSTESNGNSAIFLFSCYGKTFMFTGDAPYKDGSFDTDKNEAFEELDFINSLTADEKLLISNVSVYLVGHHGSSHSSSKDLLEILNPEFAVISVGENNNYGHPESDVIDRIASTSRLKEDYLLQTDKVGNISFSSIGSKLCYSIEVYDVDKKLTISWYELSLVIFLSTSYLIVLIKPKQRNRV